MSSVANAPLCSQKKFLKDIRAIKFHLQCLNDQRQGIYDGALEEYTAIGSMNRKIKAYRAMRYLEEDEDKIELAQEEAKILELASTYVAQLQLERLRIGIQSNRLDHENDWLKKENAILKSRIQSIQQKISVADADMQRYLFLCQIRQADMSSSETKLMSNSLGKELQVNKNIAGIVSSNLKAFYPLALSYINSSRYEVAVSLCNQSRQGKKLTPSDEGVIEYILGLTYLFQRDGNNAVQSLDKSVKHISQAQGKDSMSLVPMLIAYGKALRLENQFEPALDQLEQALNILSANGKERSNTAWMTKVDTASTFLKANEVVKASELLLSSLETASNSLNSHDNTIILMKNYIARCYVAENELEPATAIVENMLNEEFEHEESSQIVDVLKNPEAFNVKEGTDLVGVCQQCSTLLELFTLQTLTKVYVAKNEEKAAAILNEYIHCHGIDYEIE